MIDVTVYRLDINIMALDAEIRAAFGAQTTGISTGSYGVIVHLTDDVTPAQITQAETIVLNHNPAVQTPEQISADHAAAVEAAAHDQMAALPGWATWTAAQCVDYIETNVTNLATAKAVLIHMAQAICYLRNQIWSDLEE